MNVRAHTALVACSWAHFTGTSGRRLWRHSRLRVTKRRRRFAKQRDPSDRARDGLFHSLLSQRPKRPPAAARRSAKNGPCSPIPEATSAPHEGGIAATQFALNSSRAAIGGPWPSTALPHRKRQWGHIHTHGVPLLRQLKAKRRPRWSRPLRERDADGGTRAPRKRWHVFESLRAQRVTRAESEFHVSLQLRTAAHGTSLQSRSRYTATQLESLKRQINYEEAE